MADLFISVGDYVIVQEGQVDEPKIVVWDDLTVVESSALAGPILSINVFDAIVTEDPGLPNIVQTIAVEVFDIVLVREGQSNDVILLTSDNVTVTESVSVTMSLLNITVFEVVTVTEFVQLLFDPSSLAPHQIIVSDNVLVQELTNLYILIEINANESVHVVDGALNMDVNDTVTVTEDVTMRLHRLVISVNDAIAVTEFRDVFGPAIDIGAFVFDEVFTSESVTVFLTNLVPSASEDVSVTESVIVSLTSINLTIDVNDSVTVAEVLTIQPNPMQISEFTEIIVTESVAAVTGVLLISSFETVTVAEALDLQLSFLNCETFESISVTERVALRIGRGGRKRHDLTVLGAGE